MYPQEVQEQPLVLEPPRRKGGESGEGGLIGLTIQWASDDTRQEYIDDKLGPEIIVRDGPAGLKNYGATCYVSCVRQTELTTGQRLPPGVVPQRGLPQRCVRCSGNSFYNRQRPKAQWCTQNQRPIGEREPKLQREQHHHRRRLWLRGGKKQHDAFSPAVTTSSSGQHFRHDALLKQAGR